MANIKGVTRRTRKADVGLHHGGGVAVVTQDGTVSVPSDVSQALQTTTTANIGAGNLPFITPNSQSAMLMGLFANDLVAAEKKLGIFSVGLVDMPRTSTGSLAMDYITGGMSPGRMYSVSGPEASGKSTAAQHALARHVSLPGCYARLHLDPENAVSPDMSLGIYRQLHPGLSSMSQVYMQAEDRAQGVLKPVIYYQTSAFETVFDLVAGVLRRLPKKIWMPTSNEWYYLYPRVQGAQKAISDRELVIDKGRTSETELWVHADDPGPQGFVMLDSYPSLVPSTMLDAEEYDINSARAMMARLFSDHLKRVVNPLQEKAVCWYGVNQLRKNPAAMRGANPEYEPGGDALRFYSQVRSSLRAKTVPHSPTNKEEEEISVEVQGGTDVYHYKFARNTKNKIATPFLECWIRIWVKDAYGKPRGVDPVWDTYQYALLTNRIEGRRTGTKAGFKIMDGYGNVYPCDWLTFKQWILHEVNTGTPGIRASYTAEVETNRIPRGIAAALIDIGTTAQTGHLEAADLEFQDAA